jgi:hypothetical protein
VKVLLFITLQSASSDSCPCAATISNELFRFGESFPIILSSDLCNKNITNRQSCRLNNKQVSFNSKPKLCAQFCEVFTTMCALTNAIGYNHSHCLGTKCSLIKMTKFKAKGIVVFVVLFYLKCLVTDGDNVQRKYASERHEGNITFRKCVLQQDKCLKYKRLFILQKA